MKRIDFEDDAAMRYLALADTPEGSRAIYDIACYLDKCRHDCGVRNTDLRQLVSFNPAAHRDIERRLTNLQDRFYRAIYLIDELRRLADRVQIAPAKRPQPPRRIVLE